MSQQPITSIEKGAAGLLQLLDVPEHQAYIIVTYKRGKNPGWRIVVTRLSDGVNSTVFVKEPK